jgi:uracil-DNA glycosylase
MPPALPILKEARACTHCAEDLPEGPRPLVAGSRTSRVLIIGQAPGRAAHASGVPWNDRSGERLRDWLGLSSEEFYDEQLVALMPMGFCYPGTGASGDMPPRPECAPLWHDRILFALTDVQLTVLVGRYACERYTNGTRATLTDSVRRFKAHLPKRIALPHPSGRNNLWLRKNPWFEAQTLPALRARILEVRA